MIIGGAGGGTNKSVLLKPKLTCSRAGLHSSGRRRRVDDTHGRRRQGLVPGLLAMGGFRSRPRARSPAANLQIHESANTAMQQCI